jgi:hypothetical protein
LRRDGSAERKRALNREIRKIKHPERDVRPKRDQRKSEARLERTDKSVKAHSKSSIIGVERLGILEDVGRPA